MADCTNAIVSCRTMLLFGNELLEEEATTKPLILEVTILVENAFPVTNETVVGRDIPGELARAHCVSGLIGSDIG